MLTPEQEALKQAARDLSDCENEDFHFYQRKFYDACDHELISALLAQLEAAEQENMRARQKALAARVALWKSDPRPIDLQPDPTAEEEAAAMRDIFLLHAVPKLVIALPDYEKRRIVIASDEVIDGERLVCVAIEDEPSVPAHTGIDLIAQIVDRDTPPDNRNEVVDHDIRGNPITCGDVVAFAKARSTPQSFGYVMQHKNGGDRGFSWHADNPLFSADWERIKLAPAPVDETSSAPGRGGQDT